MQFPEYIPYRRRSNLRFWLAGGFFVVIAVAGAALFGIPRLTRAISWRLDMAYTYVRALVYPVRELPTPAVAVQPRVDVVTPTASSPVLMQQPTATPAVTLTPTLVPTPIPGRVQLAPPAYNEARDKQDINNCGPATLALYLRYFGWEGNQFDISKLIKPMSNDRNVNVEELVFNYVRTRAGWMNAEYRVGGDLEMLKKLIASGIPVMIEETFTTDRKYWPEDDRWAGHYLMITGYDDALQQFTVHDTEVGPNQRVAYEELDRNWQSFNRVYIMVYPPEMQSTIETVLGENWVVDINRQNALETAERETQADPENAFTWFNLGTNLMYFERYAESAAAYDTARTIGLPQRMLRYQFGPFISYFHSLQTEELMALTKYALVISPTSEEAMLWRGWGFYRQGESDTAMKYFRDALKINPEYEDAKYAIEYLKNN